MKCCICKTAAVAPHRASWVFCNYLSHKFNIIFSSLCYFSFWISFVSVYNNPCSLNFLTVRLTVFLVGEFLWGNFSIKVLLICSQLFVSLNSKTMKILWSLVSCILGLFSSWKWRCKFFLHECLKYLLAHAYVGYNFIFWMKNKI